MMSRIAICSLALVVVLAAPLPAGDSPAFRGAAGDGKSNESDVPLSWGPTEHLKWRVPLPARGNSSPIVSAGRVFVTVANADGTRRSLHCFDRNDGRELWVRTVEFDRVERKHDTNDHGASTPSSDGRRVVVWHGSAGLYCYDHAGKKLWSLDPGDVHHMWGFASSPVLYRDRVFLHFGPGVETFMLAVSLETGELLWKTDEPGGANDDKPRMVASFSTPIIARVKGKDQLICSMATRVAAYDPGNGKVLWSVGGLASTRGALVYSSPLIAGDMGIVMSGYQGPAMGFRLGGSGDVTSTNRLWYAPDKQPQRIGSGVVVGDHVYVANAGPGTVQCLEIKTGKIAWQARLPGGHSWSSTVLAGGRLYVTYQQGTTHVFRPSPEKFELLSSNQLSEPSNSTPAFSDGEVFLRTFKALYCVSER